MDHSDVSLYVMTPEFGAATQLEKSTCLILLTWCNKQIRQTRFSRCFERCKQYQRKPFVGCEFRYTSGFGTIASQFNDPNEYALQSDYG
jgi:methylmalonyl-CoA mutase